MCVFCSVSNPKLIGVSGTEPPDVMETTSWIVGFLIWLVILYQGYQKCETPKYPDYNESD